MSHLVWAVLLVGAALAAFQIGRRWELGRKEREADRLEAERERRAGRSGTVNLNTMKIRR